MSIDKETARERQSRVVKSGNEWEKYVKLFLEERLKGTGIQILWESEAQRDKELGELLTLPTGFRNEFEWDDVDLLAVKDGFPIAVLNCKSSIHGRMSLYFWALLYKINRRVKFVVISPDSGAGGATWRSEWGTPDNPSKYRELARRYVDAIYIENVPEFCKAPPNDGTTFGDIIRPLEELPEDMIRWCEDLKFYGKQKSCKQMKL